MQRAGTEGREGGEGEREREEEGGGRRGEGERAAFAAGGGSKTAMRPVRSALSALDTWVESYKKPAPRVPPLNLASLPVQTRKAPPQHMAQGGVVPAGGCGAVASSEDTSAAVPHHDQSRQADEGRQGGAAGAAQGNISQPGVRGAGILGALGCVALSSMRVFAGRRGQRGSSEREDGEMLREQSCPHDINPPRLPSPIEESFFKSHEAKP